MDKDTAHQLAYLRESGRIDIRARPGEAGSPDDFAGLASFERRQIVRQCAVQELREANMPGWISAPDSWVDCVSLARALSAEQPATMSESLAASGVPVREDAAKARVAMREAATTLREANGNLAHRTVAVLDQVVPPGHPDRAIVDELKRRGAALSHDEIDQAIGLAQKHRDKMEGGMVEATAAASAGALERNQSPDPCPACASTGIEMATGGLCPECDGNGYLTADGPAETPSSVSSGTARTKRARQRISDESVIGSRWPGVDADEASNGRPPTLEESGVPTVKAGRL
jgi:hypothetical protein